MVRDVIAIVTVKMIVTIVLKEIMLTVVVIIIVITARKRHSHKKIIITTFPLFSHMAAGRHMSAAEPGLRS